MGISDRQEDAKIRKSQVLKQATHKKQNNLQTSKKYSTVNTTNQLPLPYATDLCVFSTRAYSEGLLPTVPTSERQLLMTIPTFARQLLTTVPTSARQLVTTVPTSVRQSAPAFPRSARQFAPAVPTSARQFAPAVPRTPAVLTPALASG